MKQQADLFKAEKSKLLAGAKASAEEKDRLIQVCIEYIQALEHEKEYLQQQNEKLSREKQEMLDLYRGMLLDFAAA